MKNKVNTDDKLIFKANSQNKVKHEDRSVEMTIESVHHECC